VTIQAYIVFENLKILSHKSDRYLFVAHFPVGRTNSGGLDPSVRPIFVFDLHCMRTDIISIFIYDWGIKANYISLKFTNEQDRRH
jgi:hypothetical protein